jgi:hypothetical protein
LIGQLFLIFPIGRVSSGPSNYASFRAERDDPAASAIRSRELIEAHLFSQATANGLRFTIDCRTNQIPIYS